MEYINKLVNQYIVSILVYKFVFLFLIHILDKLHISHNTKIGDLRQKLCDYLAIPSSKLKVNGLNGVEDTDILCPKNDIELLLATI